MDKSYDKDGYERSLSQGFPIILYLHGITGSRINDHRLELYKRLQAMDYHVIAVDYRGIEVHREIFKTDSVLRTLESTVLNEHFLGYADSASAIPLSEEGVITDAKAAYSYIKKHSHDSKIIVWGHSLGTG